MLTALRTPHIALSKAVSDVAAGRAGQVVVEMPRGQWLGLLPEARGSIPGWTVVGHGRGVPYGEGCIHDDLYLAVDCSRRLRLTIGRPSGPCRQYEMDRITAVRTHTKGQPDITLWRDGQ